MKKKIAFLINHLSFFHSHLMPHVLIARKKGYDIKVFCGKHLSEESEIFAKKQLKLNKIKFINCGFDSTSLNPANDVVAFFKLLSSVKKFKPDIIHITTPKAQILGGIVAKVLKIQGIIIFVSGMGYLFSNNLNFVEKIYKFLFFIFQKKIFNHENIKVIVENKNDYKYFINSFLLSKKKICIIKGSGVDLKKFKKINIKKNNIILLPARVLKEKGILEFIAAARILKKKYNFKFVVAGSLDYKKMSNFSLSEINKINYDNVVEFAGYQKNILKLYKKTAIVCLPSYREGLPKSLCEAAALGLPIVTTRAVGCTEVVKQNFNGELCFVKDPISLARKLEKLILNPLLRNFYGKNSILLARSSFDINIIGKKMINIYRNLLVN